MPFPHRFRIAIVVFGFFLTHNLAATAFDEATEAPVDDKAAKSVVLKGAMLHTMGSDGSFVGSIVITDGKIAAIGEEIDAPDSATVYELNGFHVTPGLIESRGNLWLTSGAVSEGNSKAELNVVDAVDPWNEDWKELAAQGITSVYVQPNSLSSVGGLGAVLRVGPHGSVDDLVIKDEVAVQVSIGTTGRSSRDRFAQVQALEKLLKSAQDKKKDADKDKKDTDEKDTGKDKPDDEEDSDDEEEKDGDDSDEDGDKKDDADDEDEDDADDDDQPKKKDVTKDLLKRVLKREIPLFVEVHHSDALKRVVALAEEFEIRVVLSGLSQVASCADELDDCSHAMVLGPFFESGDAPAYRKDGSLAWFAAAKADEKLWALATFASSARQSQALRINAAHAIREGIDASEVLKAVTSNAARILGVSDHIGTLEVGKQADIAVFAGHPLDSSSPARLVMSHGKVIFENDVAASESTEFRAPIALAERLPARYAVKTTRLLKSGKFGPGTIVIQDGKILEVSDLLTDKVVVKVQNTENETEVPIYDLGDTVVTPGLVIAHSSLGQAATISDATESDASHLRSVDAFDPTTEQADETLEAGFVHIGLAPDAATTSSGAMGHVRLGASDYVVDPVIANQFVLGGSARNRERFPASLNGQVRMIRDLFDGDLVASRIYLSDSIARAIAAEKVACVNEVVAGKRKSVFIANDKVEIRSAIALAQANKLSPAIASTGPVGDLADELVDSNAGLMVIPVSTDSYGSRLSQTKTAVDAGLAIGFVGDSAKQVRTTASMLAAAGVPAEQILLGLTEGGAGLVGMENVGLTKGAAADFVVWSDSPLNVAAKPLNVVVDGKPVSKK